MLRIVADSVAYFLYLDGQVEMLNPLMLPPDVSITKLNVDAHTTESSLTIDNITRQNEGFYTCCGENSVPNVIDSPEKVSVEVFIQGLL